MTIEGSHYMPTDLLGRGQRATVEVTDTIRKLVQSGGAIVVAGSLDEPDAVAYGGPKGGEFTESPFPSDSVLVDLRTESDDEPTAEDDPKPRRTRTKSSGES